MTRPDLLSNLQFLKGIEPQLLEVEKDFYQSVKKLGAPLDLSFVDSSFDHLNLSPFDFWSEPKRKKAAQEADVFYETQVNLLKQKIHREMEKIAAATEVKINRIVDEARRHMDVPHPALPKTHQANSGEPAPPVRPIHLRLRVPYLAISPSLNSWSVMMAIQTSIKMPTWLGSLAGPVVIGHAYEQAQKYYLWDKLDKHREEIESAFQSTQRKLRSEWAKTVNGFKEDLNRQMVAVFDLLNGQSEMGNTAALRTKEASLSQQALLTVPKEEVKLQPSVKTEPVEIVLKKEPVKTPAPVEPKAQQPISQPVEGTSENSSFTLTLPSPPKGEEEKEKQNTPFPRPLGKRIRVRGAVEGIFGDALEIKLKPKELLAPAVKNEAVEPPPQSEIENASASKTKEESLSQQPLLTVPKEEVRRQPLVKMEPAEIDLKKEPVDKSAFVEPQAQKPVSQPVEGASENSAFTLTPPDPLKGAGENAKQNTSSPRPLGEKVKVRGAVEGVFGDALEIKLKPKVFLPPAVKNEIAGPPPVKTEIPAVDLKKSDPLPVKSASPDDILKKIIIPIDFEKKENPLTAMPSIKAEDPLPVLAPPVMPETENKVHLEPELKETLPKAAPLSVSDGKPFEPPALPKLIESLKLISMDLAATQADEEIKEIPKKYTPAEFQLEIDQFLKERKTILEALLGELKERLAEAMLDEKIILTAEKIKNELGAIGFIPKALTRRLADHKIDNVADFQTLYGPPAQALWVELNRRYTEICRSWEEKALNAIKALVDLEFGRIDEKFREQLQRLIRLAQNAYQQNQYDQYRQLRSQIDTQYHLDEDCRKKIGQISFPPDSKLTLEQSVPLSRLKEPWIEKSKESLREFSGQWDEGVRRMVDETVRAEVADHLKQFDVSYSEMNLRIWDGLLDEGSFALLQTAGDQLQKILNPSRANPVPADNYLFSDGSSARAYYFSQYELAAKLNPEIEHKKKLYSGSFRVWENKITGIVHDLIKRYCESVYQKIQSQIQKIMDWDPKTRFQQDHYDQLKSLRETLRGQFELDGDCLKKIEDAYGSMGSQSPPNPMDDRILIQGDWIDKSEALLKVCQADWDREVERKLEQDGWAAKAEMEKKFQQSYEDCEKAVEEGALNAESISLLQACGDHLNKMETAAPSGLPSAHPYYLSSGQTIDSQSVNPTAKPFGATAEFEKYQTQYLDLRKKWETRGADKIRGILEERYKAVHDQVQSRIQELKNWNREESYKKGHFDQLVQLRKTIPDQFQLPEDLENKIAEIQFPAGSPYEDRGHPYFYRIKTGWVDLCFKDLKAYEERWDKEVEQFVEYYCNGVVAHIGDLFQNALDEVSLRVSEYLLDEKSLAGLKLCRDEVRKLQEPSLEIQETADSFYFSNGATTLNHYLTQYHEWLDYLDESVAQLEESWDRKLQTKLGVLVDKEITAKKESQDLTARDLAESIDKQFFNTETQAKWRNWKIERNGFVTPSELFKASCREMLTAHGENSLKTAHELLTSKFASAENQAWFEELCQRKEEMERIWRRKINNAVYQFVQQAVNSPGMETIKKMDELEKRAASDLFDMETYQMAREIQARLRSFRSAPADLSASAPIYLYPDGTNTQTAVENEYAAAMNKERELLEKRAEKAFQVWDESLKTKIKDEITSRIKNGLPGIHSNINAALKTIKEKGISPDVQTEIEMVSRESLLLQSLDAGFKERHQGRFLLDKNDFLTWAADFHQRLYFTEAEKLPEAVRALKIEWDERLFQHHSGLMEHYVYGEVIDSKAPVPYVLHNQIDILKQYFKTRLEADDKSELSARLLFNEQLLGTIVDQAMKTPDDLFNSGDLKFQHYFQREHYPEELQKSYADWKAKYVQAIRWEIEKNEAKKMIGMVHFDKLMIRKWMDNLIEAVKSINEFFALEYYEKTESTHRG